VFERICCVYKWTSKESNAYFCYYVNLAGKSDYYMKYTVSPLMFYLSSVNLSLVRLYRM